MKSVAFIAPGRMAWPLPLYVTPKPFHPVVHGMLLTDGKPRYRRQPASEG